MEYRLASMAGNAFVVMCPLVTSTAGQLMMMCILASRIRNLVSEGQDRLANNQGIGMEGDGVPAQNALHRGSPGAVPVR